MIKCILLLLGLMGCNGVFGRNLAVNGGFEDSAPVRLTVNDASGTTSCDINGWRVFNTADNDMMFEVVSDAELASEGTNYLLVSSLASAADKDGGVDIDWRASGPGAVALERGVAYTFSFDLKHVSRSTNFNTVTFVLRNLERAGGRFPDTFVNSVLLSPSSDDWSHYEYTFIPTREGVLYAGFRPKDRSSIVTETFLLDNVTLTRKRDAAIRGAGSSWIPGETTDRPNILMILTDDQGFADVGANGHPILKTPNMDRIAAEGVRFTQFQACAECAPTRAGLMTGRNPFRVGVTCTFLGKYYLQEEQRTLADLLGDAGYQTAIIGKWHLGEHYPSRPQDKGFDYSFYHQGGALGPFQNVPWGQSYVDAGFVSNGRQVQTKGFATDVEMDTALSWLQQRDPDRPFFLYLPTSAPHSPYTPPKADMQRFLDMGWNAHVAGFYGLIENLDCNLGRLLDYLDRSGLSENTLVVFMGDNGTSISHMPHKDDPQPLWNAGLKGGKSWGDEGGTRVPCFMRWPGKIQPGRVSNELAAYYDFLPTFLDVAGSPQLIPSSAEGVSLKNHLLNPQTTLPDRMICNIGHLFVPPTKDFDNVNYLNRISVRSKQFRMFRRNSLYDVQNDPGETVNLAEKYPEVLREMERTATRFWEESKAAALAPVPIYLGTRQEPVVMLTSVDWRPLTSGQGEAAIQPIAFWMGQGMSQQMLAWQNQGVRPKGLEDKKEHLNGFWNVFFTRPGTYEFRATLTPPEVRGQVHLKEGTVWLKVAGETVCEAPVQAGSQEAVLRWNVEQPFRGELQVVWSGQLPFDAELGAFVCDVERVE